MQTIVHEYHNLHTLFTQFDTLYTALSDLDVGQKSPLFNISYSDKFMPLFELLDKYVWNFRIPKITPVYIEPLQLKNKYNPKSIIVCASGGKDSAAVISALQMKGYEVHLYYMKGINKVYPDELEAVKELADYFHITLYIEEIKLLGTHNFTEHPLKNMMIANGAINYGIVSGYGTQIAFGTFTDSKLKSNPFEVCGGDCIEMWQVYIEIVKNIHPKIDLILPLRNNKDTFDIIGTNTELMSTCISCMSPYRFREHWHKRTCDTYKVKLWKNRCGCCWKCAVEYIYCVDHALQELNSAYYIHCIEILSNTLKKESGLALESAGDVWEHYLFHAFTDSKMYEELKDATIRGKHVRIRKK